MPPEETDNGKPKSIPLQIWYSQNEEDTNEFESVMRRRMHYVIKPACLWDSIAELARKQDSDLLDTLQQSFKHIEEESFKSVFQGLFSEINQSSEKLGKDYNARNDKLCAIVGKIAEAMPDFSRDQDTIGDA